MCVKTHIHTRTQTHYRFCARLLQTCNSILDTPSRRRIDWNESSLRRISAPLANCSFSMLVWTHNNVCLRQTVHC